MQNSQQMEYEQLMLLQVDSRVKMSVWPENKLELRVKKQAYGENSAALLGSYDQNTQSWKTCQTSLLENQACGLDEFLETWPRSGLMLSGIAFRLPTLAPLTPVIGSGLLPTPSKGCGRALGYPIYSMWKSWKLDGRQVRSAHYFAASGMTAQQIAIAYEKMMGFPTQWTDLKDAEMP